MSLFSALCLCSTLWTISSILDGQTGQGGASPRAGGRDERPPTQPGAATAVAKSRWIPPSSAKRDIPITLNKNDAIFRRVRAILNKLAPEKFDKLSLELLNVGIESHLVLKGIILLIFEKALEEQKYSSLYAQLCHRLCEDSPNFEPASSSIPTFRRLLLNKCQDEFENRSKATDAYDRRDGPLADDEVEQYHLAKHKMLGNIKFIGELGKLEMLHEGILHKCIKQLLEKKKNLPIREMAEDLECLCQIIRTVGRRLDLPRAKAWMDQYFERIRVFAMNPELPSRIRFMLQDVMELRSNQWNPRKVQFDKGPRTMGQIRKEAAEELDGYYTSAGGRSGANVYPGRSAMNGGGMMSSMRGGIGDIFGMSPSGMVGSIGTGPGVIHMDGFIPGYSTNMGRQRNVSPNPGYPNQYNNNNSSGSGAGANTNSGGNRRQENGSPRMNRSNKTSSPTSGGQQSQQQQKQSSSVRDLPPRFQKMTPPSGGGGSPISNKEEISLRPAKNFTVFKPASPNMLPKSAQGSLSRDNAMKSGPTGTNPLLIKQPQITIKPANQDKSKSIKKTVPTKEEVEKTTTRLFNEYLKNLEVNEALTIYKELSPPKKYVSDIITQIMISTIDKGDEDKENIARLLSTMKTKNLMTSEQFLEGFCNVIDQMSELESARPLIKSNVAKLASLAVVENIISLTELSEPMENGRCYPLFLLCLQQMHKVRDKEWLINIFNNSKVNLQHMLPESDRNKDRMIEILEDRGLSFIYPMLRIQNELWKQIQTEPNAAAIFKWIKDKVDTSLHQTPDFINVLTTSLMRYVTQESTLADDVDKTVIPDKRLIEKEKDLLDKMKGILQMLLHNQQSLQVIALYSVQVFCYNHQFPKGMLLRLFITFYEEEIVEEEIFLKWKEEVNDEYPGKGKALFQVNQWLTWLEQAEEESEEEENGV